MIDFYPDSSVEYLHCTNGLLYKFNGKNLKYKESIEKLVESILKRYPDSKKTTIDKDIIIEHKDFVVSLCQAYTEFSVSGSVRDIETLKVLVELNTGIYDHENEDKNVVSYDFYVDRGDVCYKDQFLKVDDNLSKLYIPYIDTDDLFEKFFGSREKILLLTGKSGIGKSKLSALATQYLSKHSKKNVSSVATASDIDVLSDDNFWSYLDIQGIDLVILDDLDYLLTPRTEEQSPSDIAKNKFISNFLSFTDGFKHNNVKFIITTNQEVSTIDKSLLRRGRMFDILELRKLTNQEAKEIWEQLTDKPFKLKGEILACDLAFEIENSKRTKNDKSYLKDKTVSKLKKTETKIGF